MMIIFNEFGGRNLNVAFLEIDIYFMEKPFTIQPKVYVQKLLSSII